MIKVVTLYPLEGVWFPLTIGLIVPAATVSVPRCVVVPAPFEVMVMELNGNMQRDIRAANLKPFKHPSFRKVARVFVGTAGPRGRSHGGSCHRVWGVEPDSGFADLTYFGWKQQ